MMYKKSLRNGKYILEQQLDERDFDRTYKAFNSRNGRSVVIKEFQLQLKGKIVRDYNEKDPIEKAQKLVKCEHPNIVRFNDFFIEDEIFYIVREKVIGESLDRIVLPGDPLEEAIAINYIRQIGAGLKALHRIGLLHKNIKPQNLILQENNGEIVLIGWLKGRKSINNKRPARLQPDGYIPIEHYLPKAKPTPATDIYSLAATLYTLVTAQIPISADLQNHYHLNSPKQLRSDLSSEISIAIMQGMEIEQEDRPQNIDRWLALLPESNRNRVYFSQQKYDLVSNKSSIKKAIDYMSAVAYNNRAFIYSKQKKWDLALANYTQAIAIDPNFARAYFNRGTIYQLLEKWDLTLADYTKAIAIDPNFDLAYFNRGNIYQLQEKWDLAIADYTKALAIDPNFARAYFNRGNIYQLQEKWDLAIADYTKAIAIDPNFARAYYNRGNIYQLQKKWDLAIADYTKALAIDPNFARPYFNRGTIYQLQEKWDLALADYTKAIAIDPNFARPYFNRGTIYANQKKWDLALASFNEYIEINPNFARAYAVRGRVYINLGNKQKAFEDLQRAAQLFQKKGNQTAYQQVINYINSMLKRI